MCKGVVNAWPAAVRESSYAAPVTTTGIQARSHAFCGNHACAPRRSNGSRCTSHRHGSAKICTSVCISDPIDEPGTPSDGNAPHQIDMHFANRSSDHCCDPSCHTPCHLRGLWQQATATTTPRLPDSLATSDITLIASPPFEFRVYHPGDTLYKPKTIRIHSAYAVYHTPGEKHIGWYSCVETQTFLLDTRY